MSDNGLGDFSAQKFDPLKVKSKKIDDVDFCILMFMEGYIDPQNVAAFQEELDKALASGYINFIFDCEELNHISSTNLGVFTDLQNAVKPYGGEIVFYGLQGKVLEVFSLLGFYDYFIIASDIYESIDLLLYREEESSPVKEEVFPLAFRCPICDVRLKAQKQGVFQCSSCKTTLDVSEEGNVTLA